MPKRNNQSSHKHKKLNKYTASPKSRDNKKKFNLWWLLPICAVAAFIIALILGNFLGKKVEDSHKDNVSNVPESSDILTDSDLPKEPTPIDVNQIKGIFVGLEGIHDQTALNISSQIPEGTKAISLSMFTMEGNPMYKSAVAESFSQYCGDLTLKNIFVTMEEKDIYVSVPFPSKALLNSDEAKQDVMNAYEISLMKELYESGADEIIIKVADFGKPVGSIISSEGFAKKFAFYISEIKLKLPNLRVGFAISHEEAYKDAFSEEIENICKYADFCAVDFTAFGKDENLESFTNALDAASVNILRRNMRILISAKNEKSMLALEKHLDKFKMNNRQIVKPYSN